MSLGWRITHSRIVVHPREPHGSIPWCCCMVTRRWGRSTHPPSWGTPASPVVMWRWISHPSLKDRSPFLLVRAPCHGTFCTCPGQEQEPQAQSPGWSEAGGTFALSAWWVVAVMGLTAGVQVLMIFKTLEAIGLRGERNGVAEQRTPDLHPSPHGVP